MTPRKVRARQKPSLYGCLRSESQAPACGPAREPSAVQYHDGFVRVGRVDQPHQSARSLSRGEQDRKSTRLNSSHLGISYAVFCLIPPPPTPTLFPYTTLFRSDSSQGSSPTKAVTLRLFEKRVTGSSVWTSARAVSGPIP